MTLNSQEIIEVCDGFLSYALKYQSLEEKENYGGFLDAEKLVYEPMLTAYMLHNLSMAYSEKISAFYRNEDLISRIEACIEFLNLSQCPDGSFDAFFSGDFKSSCNAAFMATPICRAYSLIGEKISNTHRSKLLQIIKKIEANLVVGEFFTPNHRWIAIGGLSEIYRVTKDRLCVEASKKILDEGVDMNSDGCYSERAAVYSILIDLSFIQASENFNWPFLLKYVKRNCEFLKYNMHPDGEFVTEYSTRLDSEGVCGTYSAAYILFLQAAKLFQDGVYVHLAKKALRVLMKNRLNSLFHATLLSPDIKFNKLKHSNFRSSAAAVNHLLWACLKNLVRDLPAERPLKPYKKVFPATGVYRVSNGEFSLTFKYGWPNIMSFRYGDIIFEGFRIPCLFHGWKYGRAIMLKDGVTDNRVSAKVVFPSTIIKGKKYPTEVEVHLILTQPDKEMMHLSLEGIGYKNVPLIFEFAVRRKGKLIDKKEMDLRQLVEIRPRTGDFITITSKEYSIKIGPGIIQQGFSPYISPKEESLWTPSATVTRILYFVKTPVKHTFKIHLLKQ